MNMGFVGSRFVPYQDKWEPFLPWDFGSKKARIAARKEKKRKEEKILTKVKSWLKHRFKDLITKTLNPFKEQNTYFKLSKNVK